MANHGYVIVKKLPPAKKVDAELRDIVAKFPQFDLHFYAKERSWDFLLRSDNKFGMSFWLDKTYKKEPCIEFRHGHGSNFFWWIEYEIREELGLRYDAIMADDGDNRRTKPKKKRYSFYSEYARENMSRWWTAFEADRFNKELAELRTWLPEELKSLIGNDFELPEQKIKLYKFTHKTDSSIPPVLVYSSFPEKDVARYFYPKKTESDEFKETIKNGDVREIKSVDELSPELLTSKVYKTEEHIYVENPEMDEIKVCGRKMKFPKMYAINAEVPINEFLIGNKND